VGRKAASERARAALDEGDVVHDLLKVLTGNKLPSKPLTAEVGAACATELALVVFTTGLELVVGTGTTEDVFTGAGVEDEAAEERTVEEGSTDATWEVATTAPSFVAVGTALEVLARQEPPRRTGRDSTETARITRKRATMTLENISKP